MRIFNKLPKKEKYFSGNSVQHQPANNKLFVAHHNKQMTAAGRTTTTYIITNDTDAAHCAASFFLLPDPYCDVIDSEDNYLNDYISDEEEMMLFDQPPITNHSLHKI